MAEILSDDTVLVSSFVWDLGCTCLSCDGVSGDSSFLRETNAHTVYEHRGHFFRSLFLDDTTKRSWDSIDFFPVRSRDTFYDMRFHIDSSIREYRVCSCHLEHRHVDTLSECHREKLGTRPFLIRIYSRKVFSVESDIGLRTEAKIFDIFMKK